MKMITPITRAIMPMNLRNQFDKLWDQFRRSRGGQYTLEFVVLLAAVSIAATLMAGYVRGAIRANVKSTEMQLNGAMQDNRP